MARKKKPARKKKSGTAVMTVPKAEAGPPVLQRYHERRKFIAIRLRAKVVDALDRYVAGRECAVVVALDDEQPDLLVVTVMSD